MPLDHRILLEGYVPQVAAPDLGAAFAQGQAITQNQQALTLGELGMAKAKREQAQEAGVAEALRAGITTNGRLDYPGLAGRFAAEGNQRGLMLLRDLQKADLERQQTQADIGLKQADAAVKRAEVGIKGAEVGAKQAQARKAEVETLAHVNTLIYQAASSVVDQATYDRAIAYLDQTLLEPYRTRILSETPAIYDPAYVQQIQQMTRASSEVLQQQLKELELKTAQENRLAGGQLIEGEQGFDVVNPISGAVRPVTNAAGQRIQGKPTEAQSAALGYGTQALQAHKIADALEKKGLEAPGILTKGILSTPIGNYLVSEDRQLYEQAQRNFIGAVLRKESGAAISPAEMENERKRYFPQPGESLAVAEQKRLTRETTIKNLERQAARPLAAAESAQPDRRPRGFAPVVKSPYGHLRPEQLTPQQRAEEKAWLQQQLSGGR